MRLAPQAVDDPQLDAFDHGERSIVELGDVGRVSEPPDAQAKGRAETMILRERHNRNALDLERTDDLMRHQRRLVVTTRLPNRFEGIAKAATDLRQCLG